MFTFFFAFMYPFSVEFQALLTIIRIVQFAHVLHSEACATVSCKHVNQI